MSGVEIYPIYFSLGLVKFKDLFNKCQLKCSNSSSSYLLGGCKLNKCENQVDEMMTTFMILSLADNNLELSILDYYYTRTYLTDVISITSISLNW